LSVRLEGLSKRFGDLIIFDKVTLEIHQGELFSLVGPSGSGKTTLLRMVAGLETQDTGSIYIGSKKVDSLGPSDRNVGMVFQDYALYPHKTVLENIISPLIVKGVKKTEAMKEARDMAELLEIGATLSRRPGQISGGQQQRVALARALIKKPDVFLLDEPLSNLDAQLRFSAREFLRRVQREFGITTIYVTHDQSEALSISDRVAVMGRGKLHQVGTPEEVYTKPANEFVATFIGSPPLNVMEMDVVGGVSSPVVLHLDGIENGRYRIGVRPEHVVIGAGPTEAVITAFEYAGRETIVRLKVVDTEIRSIVDEVGTMKVGQKVSFDVQAGRALILARGAADRA
jgi:multiple sugar transport system ATP-binding protein